MPGLFNSASKAGDRMSSGRPSIGVPVCLPDAETHHHHGGYLSAARHRCGTATATESLWPDTTAACGGPAAAPPGCLLESRRLELEWLAVCLEWRALGERPGAAWQLDGGALAMERPALRLGTCSLGLRDG
jgi:hypothetical protein